MKAKPPKTNLYARYVGGTDVGLMGDDLAPKPDDNARQMLAGRVLANGAGEDVGRPRTASALARSRQTPDSTALLAPWHVRAKANARRLRRK